MLTRVLETLSNKIKKKDNVMGVQKVKADTGFTDVKQGVITWYIPNERQGKGPNVFKVKEGVQL